MPLFCCPLCGGTLAEGPRALRCPAGHCFDRAKEGYVHLLPVGQKHSKAPGDDKGMVAARRAFLDKGWYQPLRDALCRLAVELSGPSPVVLDAGCGEGYYTGGVHQALLSAGKAPRTAGVEISTFSLPKAAKRYPEVAFAVASAYRLPVASGSASVLLDVFSPLALDEFRRVLAPGGLFLYVVPAARHLWQLKEILYDHPYPNEEKETPYEGFVYDRIVPVSRTIRLPGREEIQALFQMTPYYWKTSRAGAARLEALEELEVETSFQIHVFRRTDAV